MKKYFIAALGIFISFALNSSPVELEFSAEYFVFDNADMAKYNQGDYEKNQPLKNENTDDKTSFMLSTLMINYSKRYLNTDFAIKTKTEGYWGNDNLGENSRNNFLYFENLYASVYFTDFIYARIGRQNYSIGHAAKDYIFSDIIDGLKVSSGFLVKDIPMEIDFITDVTGVASKPETTNKFSHIDKDDDNIEDFNGDTLSVRTGLSVSYYCADLFAYYLRYAASRQGGADISENGANTANKADGDYLTLYGLRLYHDNYLFGKNDLTAAFCSGYDFQYNEDLKYSGYSIVFNNEYDFSRVFAFNSFYLKNIKTLLSVGYFSSDFCSMKGDAIGGYLLDKYYGYHPSAVAGPYAFIDYDKKYAAETYVDKTASKIFYQFSVITSFDFGLSFDLSYLRMTANSKEAKGKVMGDNLSAAFLYDMNNVKFKLGGEIFMPGNYYKQVSETNAYVPKGKDPFYCVFFSMSYGFTLLD